MSLEWRREFNPYQLTEHTSQKAQCVAAKIFVVFIFRNLFALISPFNIFREVNNTS